jgi:transcription initiation factor IIE alpha subunit
MSEKPALVVELIRLIARVFYRDEYVVVLDRLACAPFLRDDDLRNVFALPPQQVRQILRNLQSEFLVACDENVSENKRKVGKQVDIEQEIRDIKERAANKERKRARGAAAARARDSARALDGQRFEDDSSEGDSDSSSDGGGGAGGAGGGGAGEPSRERRRHRRRVTVSCWYVNPRWFVDVVNFRLYLMRRHLARLEQALGSECAFACARAGCPYTATLLEAEARRVSQARSGPAHPGGMDTVSGSIFASSSAAAAAGGASAAADPFAYRCALCATPLLENEVEFVATAAKRAADRLNAVLRATGVEPVLRELDAVPLGAHSPRQLILSGQYTLLGPTPEESAAAAAAAAAATAARLAHGADAAAALVAQPHERAAAGGGAAVAAAGARVYAREKKGVDVVAMDAHGGSGGKALPGGGAGPSGAAQPPAQPPDLVSAPSAIAAAAVPDFLRKSYLTGQASTQFGFVGVAAVGAAAGDAASLAGDGAGAGGGGADEAEAAALWAALFSADTAAAVCGDGGSKGVAAEGGEEEWEDV